MNKAYINRVMIDELEDLLKEGGKFHWIIDYVKNEAYKKDELDFQNTDKQFSVYRGTSKIFSLDKCGRVDAAESYKIIDKKRPVFFDNPTKENLEILLRDVEKDSRFTKFIKASDGKYTEGWYQSIIGRRYTFGCTPNDEFIIVDKELIISFAEDDLKRKCDEKMLQWLTAMREKVGKKFKNSKHQKGYHKMDLIGISPQGKLWLIEVKQDNAKMAEIYNSPIQIGTYYKRISKLMDENFEALQESILEILKQKKHIGLIEPQWEIPQKLVRDIKLAIVVGGNYKNKTGQERFEIVKNLTEEDIKKEIHLFSCDETGTLTKDPW